MSINNRPLKRHSNEIKSTEVHKYVADLKHFFGSEALAKAQAGLDKDLIHHGQIYQMCRQGMQPWLFALRLYDHVTLNGAQTPDQWPSAIQRLAGAGLMISSLFQFMPNNVKMKYRRDLLTVQQNDFIFEIGTAWHYYLEGFTIEWYELSHQKSAEFRVRGGGLDFDIECRRFSADVKNKVKLLAMADTCDTLRGVLLDRNLWGDVTVTFSDGFRFEPTQAGRWRHALRQALDTGQTTVQLDGHILLLCKLEPSPSQKYTLDEILKIEKHPSEVTFILSKSDGSYGWDPIVFRCRSPHKTGEQFREYVYKTLKTKIGTQLSKTRAGVAVARFTGIRDPHVFDESEGMKQILRKLFSRQKHLAAVVLHCDDMTMLEAGTVVHSSPAIVFRSMTSFPEVASANHLTRR